MAEEYGIENLPTFVLLKGGEQIVTILLLFRHSLLCFIKIFLFAY